MSKNTHAAIIFSEGPNQCIDVQLQYSKKHADYPYSRMAMDAYKVLQERNSVAWFSTKTVFPDDNIEVLAIDDKGHYYVGFFEDGKFQETSTSLIIEKNFTHWQHLSEPNS